MSSCTLASPAPPASSTTSLTVAVTGCACGAGPGVVAGLGVPAATPFEVDSPPPQALKARERQKQRLSKRFFRRMVQSLAQRPPRLTRLKGAVGNLAAEAAG